MSGVDLAHTLGGCAVEVTPHAVLGRPPGCRVGDPVMELLHFEALTSSEMPVYRTV